MRTLLKSNEVDFFCDCSPLFAKFLRVCRQCNNSTNKKKQKKNANYAFYRKRLSRPHHGSLRKLCIAPSGPRPLRRPAWRTIRPYSREEGLCPCYCGPSDEQKKKTKKEYSHPPNMGKCRCVARMSISLAEDILIIPLFPLLLLLLMLPLTSTCVRN